MAILELTISKILDIGIALATQKDYNKLLELFYKEVMQITDSDAGTLYMYLDNLLLHKITHNNTLKIFKGDNGDFIDEAPLSLNDNSVCTYCALNKKIVNIQDIYNNNKFNFTETYKKDLLTGYKTTSMLVIPLENHEGEIMGVLQLINKKGSNGEVVSYSSQVEHIVFSIASQAAVCISNIKYLQETKDLLYSLVSVMATAIDEKTPYNVNHTHNVSNYIEEFVDFLNLQFTKGKFNESFSANRKEQLVLAAKLHDIGKIVTPLNIMNKSTRLGSKLERIGTRFKLIEAYLYIDFLEGKLTKEQYDEEILFLSKSYLEINLINKSSFLQDIQSEIIKTVSNKVYVKSDGTCIKYIEDNEKDCLLIQKGTLTNVERRIMENHVVVTNRMLEEIHFNKSYENVPKWAASHHEYLDGSGYPANLCAKDLPTDVRILVIMDIFESLTSKDRPYKEPIPIGEAFTILNEMVEDGKLDGDLIEQLKLLYLN